MRVMGILCQILKNIILYGPPTTRMARVLRMLFYTRGHNLYASCEQNHIQTITSDNWLSLMDGCVPEGLVDPKHRKLCSLFLRAQTEERIGLYPRHLCDSCVFVYCHLVGISLPRTYPLEIQYPSIFTLHHDRTGDMPVGSTRARKRAVGTYHTCVELAIWKFLHFLKLIGDNPIDPDVDFTLFLVNRCEHQQNLIYDGSDGLELSSNVINLTSITLGTDSVEIFIEYLSNRGYEAFIQTSSCVEYTLTAKKDGLINTPAYGVYCV
jgi:hypothetical protein